jgi:putative spermidine/putrescine transport system ATP-binding protein
MVFIPSPIVVLPFPFCAFSACGMIEGERAMPSTPAVRLAAVSRRFGAVTAADQVDLDIAPGEFFAMLGPSGSGKTTCLRLIAGFEQPDEGRIEIFGEDVAGLPAYRRPVNTVFQDYALFPHMTVGENVAYGLKVRGVDRSTREKAALEALTQVRLKGYETRKPSQLSGGQRQRVALARALVLKPKVMLLDEPLGALDLKLREEMQSELKSLQRALGLAFVFVTHDQGEALGMSDRLAVFDKGRVLQTGTPQEVYLKPNSRFVADFVGSSNILEKESSVLLGGPDAVVSLRPERVVVGQGGLAASVEDITFQGPVERLNLRLHNGALLNANVASGTVAGLRKGLETTIYAPADALHPLGA